ncbi:MAG TPA: phosphoglycerate dehydrogenase [Gemmatimonadaceae bacterium]|nr:phosphoglycerate dehydrogenase [Gemmatimonadaceae bacterium]
MSTTYKVVVADAISRAGLAPLAGDSRFEIVERVGLAGEALGDALADADAVLVRSTARITRDVLERTHRLKVIGRAGVGVDTIDVDAATERGVAVLTAPSGNTISAAELTIALILSLARRIAAADRSMKSGAWDRKSFDGVELHGKTLGLIGAGRIGSEVARRARAFGMRVLAYDPHIPEEHARALEIELLPLEDVLRAADVVSLHVPLTEGTSGLLGEKRLRSMKRGAFLVNAARGGVVDERALVAVLRDGHLGGAALDVFETEPLPSDHPLRALDTVVLTPHLGASTPEAQHLVAIEIAEAVRQALVEGDLSRAVNAPAIAGEEMRRARPMLDLAERLGRLASVLMDAPLRRVEVRYAGSVPNVLSTLAASAMVGILSHAVGRATVNLVSALHLAKSRGIEVVRVGLPVKSDYAEYVELSLSSGGAPLDVAGAVIGSGHSRVVRLGRFHVDIIPAGSLVILRNRDVPGVIGRVGTLLGNASVNIGEYHQSRLAAGGEALAAISVDGRLGPELVTALRQLPEVIDVRQVELDTPGNMAVRRG